MAATFKPVYATAVAVNLAASLASLASSSTRTAGAQSDEIVNTANAYSDLDLAIQIMTGAGAAGNTQIDVWAIDGVNGYPDVITGAGTAAKTWTSEAVRDAGGRPLGTILVDAASRKYMLTGLSMLAAFGYVPERFVVFVAQNTGGALDATAANHFLKVQGITYQSV